MNGTNKTSGKIVFVSLSSIPKHLMFPSLSKNKLGWIANKTDRIIINVKSVMIFLESILYLLF